MTRPRRPMKSKPRVDALEERLALSRAAAAAPIAQAIAQRPPVLVQQLHHERLQAEPMIQAQAQLRAQANQDPAGPWAARAAQREEMRLQREQRREQARERREAQAAANPAPATPKITATTDTGGFSFSKVWKSIFPW